MNKSVLYIIGAIVVVYFIYKSKGNNSTTQQNRADISANGLGMSNGIATTT